MSDKPQPVAARKLLEAQKAKALQEAEQIDQELAELERFEQFAAKHGWQIVAGEESSAESSGETASANADGAPVAPQVVEKTAEWLRRRGTRATSTQIAGILAEKGITILPKRVSTYLSRRDDIFDNKPDFGGYGLVEWKGAERGPSKAKII